MSDPFSGKVWWIVGASDGLGEALARKLAKRGARLILSARRADKLQALADSLGDARALPMDVTDVESVKQAVAGAGEIDGLIYSVGYYEPMETQDWQPDAVEAMVETNFLGATRVLGRIVPQFAERDAGHVMIIGSLSGHRGLPGAVGYGASKAGLMHLAENIHADLRGTNVMVQRANPGFIETRLTAKNDFKMPQLMSPDAAADQVIKAMESGRFSTDFPRPFAWLFTLGRFLPKGWFDRIFAA